MQNLNATQAEVVQIRDALNGAMTGLGLKAQKANLQETIAEAKALKQTDYTQESLQAVMDALAEAEKVGMDENAGQQAVDAANRKLKDAMKLLALKPAQTQALADAIAAAGALTESNYTAETWAALKQALTAARELMARDELTVRDQAAVDAALEMLTAAQKALQPEKIKGTTSAQVTGADEVKTGDTMAAGWLAVLSMISGVLLAALFVAKLRSSRE